MTKNPKVIQSGEDLVETISTFFSNNIHFAPVVTPTGEILGLLSEVSLIKASLRHHLEPEKHEKVYAHRDILEPAVFVKDTDNMSLVVSTLVKSPSRRVLVQDNKGRLIGIISPKDILRFISGKEYQIIQMNDQVRHFEERAKRLTSEVRSLQSMAHIYREVFENSPLMMHSLDGQGTIIMGNRRLHEVLGYEEGALVGKKLTDLYPHTLHDLAWQGLETIKQAGLFHVGNTQMVRKDGHTTNVDIISSMIKDQNGHFLSTISISRPLESSTLLLEALRKYIDS